MKQSISDYISLLKDYNETTNIYSKKAYDHLPYHINDCSIMAEIIKNKNCSILDLGSGSGLPSVVIAISNPLNHIVAIESKSRKTNFLQIAKEKLDLKNLTIVQRDINEYLKKNKACPDYITAKAFAPIEKIIAITKGLPEKTMLLIPISEKQKTELSHYKLNIHEVLAETAHFYIQEGLGSVRRKITKP